MGQVIHLFTYMDNYTHISGIVRGYNAEVNDFNQAYSLSCQGSFSVLHHVHRWLLERNVP